MRDAKQWIQRTDMHHLERSTPGKKQVMIQDNSIVGKVERVVIQDNSFVGKVASHNSRQFLRGESSKSHNTRQFARGESSNSHTFTPIRTCIPEIRIKAKRHGKNFKRHFKFESRENLSKNITFRIQNFNTETKTRGWLRLSKSAA